MQTLVIILILIGIASAVWFLRKKKIETIETRVYRLNDAFTTPMGVKIRHEKGVQVSTDAQSAIERGIQHTQRKVFAKYGKSLTPSYYIVAIVKGEPDSSGMPSYRLPVNEYAGTVFDKGGYILVAGQVISVGVNANIAVFPEHRGNYDHLELVAGYETEHIELAWWDGDEYERTKYHGNGVSHPIIPE